MTAARVVDWHLLVGFVAENRLGLQDKRTGLKDPRLIRDEILGGHEAQPPERWSSMAFLDVYAEVVTSLEKSLLVRGYTPEDIRQVCRKIEDSEDFVNTWLLHTLAAVSPRRLAALLGVLIPGLEEPSVSVEWPNFTPKAKGFADGWLLGGVCSVALELKVRGTSKHEFDAQQLLKYLWMAEQLRLDGRRDLSVLLVEPKGCEVRSANLRGIPTDDLGNWQIPTDVLLKDTRAAELLRAWGWAPEHLEQLLSKTRFRSVSYEQICDASCTLSPHGATESSWPESAQKQLRLLAEKAAPRTPSRRT